MSLWVAAVISSWVNFLTVLYIGEKYYFITSLYTYVCLVVLFPRLYVQLPILAANIADARGLYRLSHAQQHTLNTS